MSPAIRRLGAVLSLSLLIFTSQAQPVSADPGKPYQLRRSGKQITIKSPKGIKQVMLWTSSGNRVAEHKEINNNSWVLDIPVNQKTFFLMIGLKDGKIYTEKIGVAE